MRVRIVAGPWPERIGCVGTIVEAPAGYGDRYPWHDLGGGQFAVVALDDDPVAPPTPGPGGGWSCVMDRDYLEVLDA